MANIRDLKKDVKQMVANFLQECYTHLAYSPPLHQENVLDIISDAMELRKEIVYKINHISTNDHQQIDKYFKEITSSFYDRIVELTERLNTLNY